MGTAIIHWVTQSNVLEIGCSTGFISIELARYTGARAIGVDIHNCSIDRARQNVDQSISNLVEFQAADAGKLPFGENSFSHVVISGHLPFIPHEFRVAHIREALRVLRPWGHLLVALYYYDTEPSLEMVERFNARIGTLLQPGSNRAYWASLFCDMLVTLEYQQDYDVFQGSTNRVEEYVSRMSLETQSDWQEILALFNENGRHLSYFVQVYRKVPDETPLMIQIPRGGIYEVQRK